MLVSGVVRTAICLVVMVAPVQSQPSCPPWVEVRSPHFIVIADGREEAALATAAEFERVRALLRSAFPWLAHEPSQPKVILLVRSVKEFRRMKPCAPPLGGGNLLTGFTSKYLGSPRTVIRLDRSPAALRHVIFHEYTHALAGQHAGPLPLWLEEGLGEFFSNAVFREKGVWVGVNQPGHLRVLHKRPAKPMEVLFRSGRASRFYQDSDQANLFYAQSWALVHFLIMAEGQKDRRLVQEYVNLIDQHLDPVEAARRAFGELGKLQRSFQSYVSRPFLSHSVWRYSDVDDGFTFAVRYLSEPEAAAWKAQFLFTGGCDAAATAFLLRALQADPNNAQACEAMGAIKLRRGEQAAGKIWLLRAAGVNPLRYVARYLLGVVRTEECRPGDPAGDAEDDLRTALRVAPDFAPAYAALAHMYCKRGDHVDQASQLGRKAVELDSSNARFHTILGEALWKLGRFEDAASCFRQAINSARTEEELAQARALLDAVRIPIGSGLLPEAPVPPIDLTLP